MYFKELDGQHRERVQKHMLAEIQSDVEGGRLYLSRRLTPEGCRRWESLLREAILSHTVSWLENRLISEGLLAEVEGDGRKVPVNAAQTLAEGEFNRFYCRGVCLAAIDLNRRVSVYRGKNVSVPRPRSESLLEQNLDPQPVLADLRARVGEDLIRGVPGGPNSGISLALA